MKRDEGCGYFGEWLLILIGFAGFIWLTQLFGPGM